MEREILFRGKRECDNSWEYGYVSWFNSPRDVRYFLNNNIAIAETVGQYTGIKDKNGEKIFEGDIYIMGEESITYVVVFRGSQFIGKQIGSSSYAGLEYWEKDIEVIGNIHDNPELLK